MNLNKLELQELKQEEKINIAGGDILLAIGLIGGIWGAGFAIGYTAHFIYDNI